MCESNLITHASNGVGHVPSVTSLHEFFTVPFEITRLRSNTSCLFTFSYQEHNNNICACTACDRLSLL